MLPSSLRNNVIAAAAVNDNELDQAQQEAYDDILHASYAASSRTSISPDRLIAFSSYLHGRIAAFSRTALPLFGLLELLQTFLVPGHDSTRLPLSLPTFASHADASASSRHADRYAEQANAWLHDLKQFGCWQMLVSMHSAMLSSVSLGHNADMGFDFLAVTLHRCQSELVRAVPQLANSLIQSPLAAVKAAHTQFAGRLSVANDPDANLSLLLAYLADHRSTPSPPHRHRDPEVLATNVHLAEQFGRRYRGDAPLRFLDFALETNRKIDSENERPYYRGTPIVQSSGTGKTRMVLELKQYAPLYICFRKPDANANAKAGYPFPDSGVRTFLFTTLARALSSLTTAQAKHAHLVELHTLDRVGGVNDKRNQHFQDVSESAQALLASTPPEILKASYQHVFDHFLVQPVLLLNEQLLDVSRYLANCRRAHPCPLVFVAVDECVEMNVGTPSNDQNQLHSLLRAWNYIGGLRDAHNLLQFWLVLLSTSSSATHLVEHVSVRGSARRQNSVPLPTFTAIGFDVFSEERPSLNRASEASLASQLVTYGRPLWSSLERSDFWSNAVFKLQGSSSFSDQDRAQCFSVLASRLSLGLVPVHSDRSFLFGEQKILTDQLVDRHMRVLTSVTPEAGMHINSPSEPVLAIAASLLMLPTLTQQQSWTPQRWQKAHSFYASILELFRRRCLVSPAVAILKGTHGELASRIVLMTAWDAAKRKALDQHEQQAQANLPPSSPSLSDRAQIISKPVLLQDIIAGLATLDHTESGAKLQKHFQHVQDGSARRTRPSLSSGVQLWTNFTHFDVLPEQITEITPEFLWYCWKRGLALQMAHRQPGLDGLIPVYAGHLEQPFVDSVVVGSGGNPSDDDPGSSKCAAATASTQCDELQAARFMTYVGWEAKNTEKPQPSAESGNQPHLKLKLAGPRITRALRSPDGETPLTDRALVNVLLDLGTEVAFGTRLGGMQPRVETIYNTNCPRVWIRGVTDHRAYPCLDQFEMRDVFREVLKHSTTDSTLEQLNTLPSAVWSNTINPTLPFITDAAAAAAADTTVHAEDMDTN